MLWLQTALRQSGRHEEAELCEAAARQGSGERNIQRPPVADSKSVLRVFPYSVPASRQTGAATPDSQILVLADLAMHCLVSSRNCASSTR